MPKYKRIEKNPETKAYVAYEPRENDELVFRDGERWRVNHTRWAVGAHCGGLHAIEPDLLSLTDHIERPVKVRDVRGPDYKPQVGDVFVGSDGPALTVVNVFERSGGASVATLSGTRAGYPQDMIDALAALATRIEREE